MCAKCDKRFIYGAVYIQSKSKQKTDERQETKKTAETHKTEDTSWKMLNEVYKLFYVNKIYEQRIQLP